MYDCNIHRYFLYTCMCNENINVQEKPVAYVNNNKKRCTHACCIFFSSFNYFNVYFFMVVYLSIEFVYILGMIHKYKIYKYF